MKIFALLCFSENLDKIADWQQNIHYFKMIFDRKPRKTSLKLYLLGH